jgi:NAD-dependent dihydropyrimidine dehydrogenase PreA subunit
MTPEKAPRAAAAPWRPVIDQSSCEGKRACVDVCPYNVFEVRRIDDADYKRLNLLQRVKVHVHGLQMAYAPRADECRACGLCVVACPEGAITLERT